jgi:putative solute:sodium symporter small subunit
VIKASLEGPTMPLNDQKMQAYWRENLRLLGILLSIWFLSSFGLGILWVDWLDQYQLGGFKLGFWFAQQGSIYIFVVLIFIYVYAANRLDKKYGVDESEEHYVEDDEYYHHGEGH